MRLKMLKKKIMVNINLLGLMKKINSLVMLLAASAIAFSSCSKPEPKNPEQNQNEINVAKATTFHIKASATETKTIFGSKDNNKYPTLWTANKQVAFSRDEAAFVAGTPTVKDNGKSAEFDVDLPGDAVGGTIYAFSPKGVYDKDHPENNVPGFTSINKTYHSTFLNIPSNQTPLESSVDESAQAIFGSTAYSGGQYELNISFSHVVAYGKMTITNFAGGEIESVDIIFPENVVGSSCHYYFGGDNIGTIDAMSENTISLNPANVVNNVFWFALAPTAGSTGEMKVAITDVVGDTYTKTLNLTKKALPFVKGQISTFSVNFTGIEPETIIEEGDYAILAKRSNGNYFYMTSNLGTASTKRFQAVDSGLTSLPETIQTGADKIWTVTKSGSGYFITSVNEEKQISWTSGNSSALADEGKLLTIAESESSEGALKVSFVNVTETRTIALNNTSGNDYFAFYTGSGITDLYFVPASISTVLFNITISPVDHGSVTVEGDLTQAAAGDEITLTITPDSGYQLASLKYTYGESEVDITEAKSFTMPSSDVNIIATFAPVDLPIADGNYVILAKSGDNYYAVSVDANGESSRRDRLQVEYDDNGSFETSNNRIIWTFTENNDSYTIANGTNYMGAAKNTIPLKSEDYAASVNIVDNGNDTYTLSAYCGADGTRYMAMNGTNGFGWYADGTGVKELYLVPATFVEPTYYSITVASTTNGTVTVNGDKTQAAAGETITLTITPDSGYELDVLTVSNNGGTVTVTDNKFTMPAEPVTVSATFKLKQQGGDQTFTITSADVVTNSAYTKYEKTVDNRDWLISFGGNNKSVGTNSGNRSKCNLSSYAKYVVSPVVDSDVASVFACTTKLTGVKKISYAAISGGSNQTSTNVYVIYSADGNTFSQINLTSGTQGAALSATGGTFEFASCDGYFAVLFKATNSSGNWRIDDVNLTFTYSAN